MMSNVLLFSIRILYIPMGGTVLPLCVAKLKVIIAMSLAPYKNVICVSLMLFKY